MRSSILTIATLAAAAAGLLPSASAAESKVHSPVPAAKAAALFQVDPGLRVDLVAAEPLVVAPCALAWDEAGRLFVAENRGYPTGSPDGKPAGRIALLSDTDGDGTMDHRVDFAVDLTFPNGLLPWNGGLIVTCAPDVLFLKDTNADGRADLREVWLTGFDDKNTTQLRVSHPTLGPDGWIYLTSGWTGESSIHSPKHPERPPVKVRTDSRFHPDTLEFQPIDGRAQFGQSFDDFGNRFTCFNRVHIQHVVLTTDHLQRNPAYKFSQTIQNVPETLVSDLIGGAHQNPAARIYPISDNITTADSHAGQFSAACGITIYRGNGLPPDYYGDAFACDPTGNLVHRDRLSPAGATFSSRMVNEGREFLASPDNWFRPVNLAVGPDGALYVCDMYRQIIEHPEYLPEEVRKRSDFDAGKDKGRIWRVRAEHNPTTNAVPGSARSLSLEAKVALLAHPNVWHRDTGRRMLLEVKEPGTLPLLLKLLPPIAPNDSEEILRSPRAATDPRAPGPHLGRINALNTIFALAGGPRPPANVDRNDRAAIERYFEEFARALGAIDRDREHLRSFAFRLLQATVDESPGVRAAAFRLLDTFPGEGPELGGDLHRFWSADPSPQVRFHIALFLGKCEYGGTFPALARIARQDGGDRWTRAAVLTGLHERANHFFETLLKETNGTPAPELLRELCRLDVGPLSALLFLTDRDARERVLGVAGPSEPVGWQIAGLAGLIDQLQARHGPGKAPRLADLTDKPFGDPVQWKIAPARLEEYIRAAETFLGDTGQSIAVRDAALTVLLHETGTRAVSAALRLLEPGEAPELQQRVVQALLSLPGEEAALELLRPDRWARFSPGLRAAVLGSMLSQSRHIESLLTLIEKGTLALSDINRGQRDRLRRHRDESIRTRAARLFDTAGGDRMKAFEALRPVLSMPADGTRGREVFVTHCASCHRLDQVGVSVGPDIFGMRNQPKEAILLHIIVPNHEINPDFAAYDVELRDGRTLSGLIVSETPSHVTIRQAQGIEETVARADTVSLRANGLSLMPDELETAMTRQELADLLAYLKGER